MVNDFSGLAWKGASYLSDTLKAFFTSKSSADCDLATNKDVLEYRSRHLYQNSSFAGAAINTKVLNVVGSGLKCRPQLNYKLLGITREQAIWWEKSTRALFELWANSKNCDAERENNFAQLQDLVLKTQLICGDAFALRCFKRRNGAPFGLCYKILEGNRCKNPNGIQDTQKLAMGVEVDDFGAVQSYYFTKHPIYNLDNYTDCIESVNVNAYGIDDNQNVIHVFETERPNQRRGVPWLAPVISQIKQQERYQDAELIAAVVSSFFTVFIKSHDSESPEAFMGDVQEGFRIERSSNPKAAAELSAGGIVELGANEEIQTANPARPNVNYEPFVNAIFNEIGARLGISKEVILKKFDSSYNAVRAAILESKKTFEKSRLNLATDFCQPVYDTWLSECVALGVIKCPNYDDPIKKALWHGCRWVGDAPVMLDPLKETQALKLQIDEQLNTRSNACLQVNGGEYDAVAESLAEEKEIRERLGLPEAGAVNKTESVSIQEVNGENDK